MLNRLNANVLFSLKLILLVISLFLASSSVWAEKSTQDNVFYLDRVKLISEQVSLLQNRLSQAESQLQKWQRQQNNPLGQVNKQLRSEVALDIAVAKSNLDSINIELSESEQTINRLEQDVQAIENQLNVFNLFGLKIARDQVLKADGLQSVLDYQQKLLVLEKERANYLSKLHDIALEVLQQQKANYLRINTALRSQIISQLQEKQAQSENSFQKQQGDWLQQLNILYGKLENAKTLDGVDKHVITDLQREIFYANENVSLTYLQMLIVRYQDQLRQLKISIAHSTSITLLNNASDQVQSLSGQLSRVKELLKTRMTILQRRKEFLSQASFTTLEVKSDLSQFEQLTKDYQLAMSNVLQLDQRLMTFRSTLDQALQVELSSRQGLPGLNAKEWLDLGAQIWFVPTLTYEILKHLVYTVGKSLHHLNYLSALMLSFLEMSFVIFCFFISRLLARVIIGTAQHELGHINLARLSIQLLRRNLLDIAVIGNVLALFYFLNVSYQNAAVLIKLALIWLFFKAILIMARITLVETVHDRAGHDVRLYHRLKWTFLIGGVVTSLAVLVHQLPLAYEVKDLFARLFLLFLLVVSVLLLKSWDIVPALILPHIDDRRLYLKKVVRLLGFLIPLILLVNSAIGLFGFVNLVLTVSWYESIFLVVLVGYLVMRGIMIDSMILLSTLVIRHVVNGWLWTEAILKPLDKVFRVILFFAAWTVLFLLYGWDKRSAIVGYLNTILHYRFGDVLSISVSPLIIVEIVLIISLLFWAARWTRELVYRLLLSRTKDMGLRNSIAILSQYLVILFGILIGLDVLGIDFKALVIAASGIAIVISFGLRDLANNFACGFLLLIERPLRVGDTVTIGIYEGEVTHIGSRAVTVRTWDHMDVLVPNAEIFTKSFTNWTGKDSIVRTVITIKINRHDDPHEVQSIIHRVLGDHKEVLGDPVPEVLLKEISDSLIEFEVRYFINLRQVRSRLILRSEVLMTIWEAFEKHGIKPPYPHHEIHLQGLPSVP